LEPKVTILDKDVIYSKWASFTEYKLRYTSQKFDDELTRVVFDSGDGAAILLYNSNSEKMLFVRQFRFGAFFNNPEEPMITEVCAGIIEDGNPKQSAIREALEETGYKLDEVDHVGTVYATPGAHTEKLHLFIGAYDDSMKMNNGGGIDTENEDIEVIEYSYDKVIELYNQKLINDAKTLILIQHWLIHHYYNQNKQ